MAAFNTKSTLLVVDDDEDILAAVKLSMKRSFDSILTTNDPNDIPRILAEHKVHVLLLDMNFGPGKSQGDEGLRWIQRIKDSHENIVIISVTAHGGVSIAVEAIKCGANDFVIKPWQNEKLAATLKNALALSLAQQQAKDLRQVNNELIHQTVNSHEGFLGRSHVMQSVFELIEKAGPTAASVLVLGENGTGKELAARRLHQQSQRCNAPFISVDLGALSESLFESELFGYRKGAFTGAQGERAGRFSAADGGTLFLDEIGNLALPLQAKLLTVLERREIVPLGTDHPISVDVRIIAATNMPLEQLQDETYFRQDLLFRLNTVEIHMPPLRERVDDIHDIAHYFLNLYAKKYHKTFIGFDVSAKEAMEKYPWPGNVRALRHVIERAVILSDNNSEYMHAEDLQLPNSSSKGVTNLQNASQSENNTKGTLNLAELEKNAVTQALTRHGYNISRTAKELGITRAALYRRMEKYEL